MKRKDIPVILLIVLLSLALLIWGLAQRSPSGKTQEEPEEKVQTLQENDIPGETIADESAPEDPAAPETEKNEESTAAYSEAVVRKAEEYLSAQAAESYLLITTRNNIYTPIPLNEDGSFRICRADGAENVIHIGKNSFYMESSNCDNQNCLGQGEVTLENKDTRILYDMIICAPHDLMLQMITPEDAKDVLLQYYQLQEDYDTAGAAGNAE